MRHSTGAIFDTAIRIEYEVAGLYRAFARFFSHRKDLEDFWMGMVRDEFHHAETLEASRKTLTDSQLHSQCGSELSGKIVAVRSILKRVDPDSVRTLDDAYEIAHELEFSEVNAVFRLLTTRFTSSDAAVDFISTELQQHQQKLISFKERFGDRDRRREIIAQPGL